MGAPEQGARDAMDRNQDVIHRGVLNKRRKSVRPTEGWEDKQLGGKSAVANALMSGKPRTGLEIMRVAANSGNPNAAALGLPPEMTMRKR